MACEFIDSSGIPTVCILQRLDSIIALIAIPFALSSIRFHFRNRHTFRLAVFAETCRRIALFTSISAFLLSVFTMPWNLFPVVLMLGLASVLHYSELSVHTEKVASTVLLLWWQGHSLVALTLVVAQPSVPNVLGCLLAGSAWLLEDCSSPWNPTNFDDASVYGKINMSFVEDMLGKAQQKTLTREDLAGRPGSMRTSSAYAGYLNALQKFDISNKNRVIYALLWHSRYQILFMLCADTLGDIVSYGYPLFLSLFLESLQKTKDGKDLAIVYSAIYFAIGLGMVRFLSSTLGGIRQLAANTIFLTTRSSLMEAIYHKSLTIDANARGEYDSSKIMNLLNVDAAMVQTAYLQLTTLVNTPIGFLICLAQLYFFLGPSILAAAPLYALYIPFSVWATRQQMRRFPESMTAKDKRGKSTMNIIRNMKSLKFYAWEDPYEAQTVSDRHNELSIQQKYLRIGVLFESVTSQLDSLGVAAVVVSFLYKSNQALTPHIVFPVLSLMSLVAYPLFAFPRSITALARALTAQGRINDFLLQPDECLTNYTHEAEIPKDEEVPLIEVDNACITWGRGKDAPVAINGLSFKLHRGDMCCILGTVGTGKSALLKALIAQMTIRDGSVTVRGSMAYASQEPWLQFRSLRANVLFGLEYDEEFYKKTLEACDLEADIALFPEGDLTEIGEKGISLSGGQKARVALARAVYSRADVVILDDVLSAVDQHVSKKLLANLFAPGGMLESSTIVLATHTARSLKLSSYLICFSKGGVPIYNGPAAQADAASLVSATGGMTDEATALDLLPVPSFDRRAEVKERKVEYKQKVADPDNLNANFEADKLTHDEMFPDVPIFYIFRRYMDFAGHKLAMFALFALATAVLADNLVSIWLSIWSDKNLVGLRASEFYLSVYLILVFFAALCLAISYYTNIGILAIRASQKLHDAMLHNVIHAPMMFFERTPLGSIMNRFTGDISMLDGMLPQLMYSLVRTLLTLVVGMSIAIVGAPFIIVILVPLLYKYNAYRKQYVPCSRQIQKLSSAARGPILSHIEESVRGVATVTVFGARKDFITGYERRGDYWMSTAFLRSALRRWLSYRISMMTAILIMSSAFSVLFLVRNAGLPVSLAGIVMFSVQRVGAWLSWIISSWTDLEVSVVAAERVLGYIDQPTEAKYRLPASEEPDMDELWPTQGSIKFNGYSTKFRPELDDVLHDIHLTIRHREKIGVVGRTGAGKSTLTLSIFRMLEASAGAISIDDVPIAELGLFHLRSRLSIIPQDAQIFKGTLRENLDPLLTSTDARLWEILELCHLKDHFASGLDTELAEGGENISRGQAQLICLGRALLRTTKVLILDEATASVDSNTDSLVQSTIRKEFRDRTIITIAHRIDTILDSDRILVLEKGKIVEFDTPKKLLEEKGAFYDLVQSHAEM